VNHLRLSAETGIGEPDLRHIGIVNRDIFEARKLALSHELLDRFPADLRIFRGKERCCPEGCRRSTETAVEVLHADHGGIGGFAILMGKGIDPESVDGIRGKVHIAGSCAIEDHCQRLIERLGRENVTMSPGCCNLSDTISGLCRNMKVRPLSMLNMNWFSSLLALLASRLKGSKAIVPPVL
jgi:hypothetical protein